MSFCRRTLLVSAVCQLVGQRLGRGRIFSDRARNERVERRVVRRRRLGQVPRSAAHITTSSTTSEAPRRGPTPAGPQRPRCLATTTKKLGEICALRLRSSEGSASTGQKKLECSRSADRRPIFFLRFLAYYSAKPSRVNLFSVFQNLGVLPRQIHANFTH